MSIFNTLLKPVSKIEIEERLNGGCHTEHRKREELNMVGLIQGKYEKVKTFYEKNMAKKYFEFQLAYVSQNEVFREIDRFLWESRHQMTRFKNNYQGPVLIDLSCWNENELNIYFEAFMFFLKDNGFYECTFMIQEECCKELLEKLKEFFEISVTSLNIEKKAKKMTIGFVVTEKEIENVRS